MIDNGSLNESYFNDVYSNKDDPWDFETSGYERNKYQATLEALSRKQYNHAFEIGCSIGVLTQLLAARCNKLLSVDVSELPLEKARKRLKDHPQVTIKKMAVPAEFPPHSFDLIILSEVGYYWSLPDLHHAQQLIIQHLHPKGQLLLVHWTPFVPDYPLTGDQVHNSFLELAGKNGPFHHLLGKREEKYRLDLLELS